MTDGLACTETMQCPNGQTCDLDSLVCYEVPPVSAKFVHLAAGANHTCGIDQSGALYCWGQNDNGQLGVGDSDGRAIPTRVGDQTDWTAIAAGGSSTCGLRGTTLWCWGDRLDVGATSNVPLQIVTPMTTWVAVSVSEAKVGTTPWNGELDRAEGTAVFVLKKRGFADRRVEIDQRTGGPATVDLARITTGGSPIVKDPTSITPPPITPPPVSPHPTHPDRGKGEPVDPFAPKRGS